MNQSAVTPESQNARTHRAAAASWWASARRFNTVAILVVLVIAASFVSSDFLSVPNLANISRQVAGVGIMSVGMLLVVLTGGIDLSVGSVAALGSVLCALLIPEHGLWFALLATLQRCWLKGQTGDALHAVLCAAGYNLRWLLRAIVRLGLGPIFF
ncbi:ABC transporter permease, partial [Candidatus Burkholderia verschuerenii]|uniref:ABC transporter permease n=1 Tax=Candidatus Burkholderia verschuerenii TaxID=242163 RepID=UPI000A92940F